MIQFKDIELEDKELITSFTLNSPRQNCDLSFSNLSSCRFLYNTKIAVMDGFHPIRQEIPGKAESCQQIQENI